MSDLIGITRILYFLLVLSHFMSCLWLVLNRVEIAQGVENTWFTEAGLGPVPGSAEAADFVPVAHWQIYMEAAFYVVGTMMGMVFGNRYPVNSDEQNLCIVIMLTGASIYATFFSYFVVMIYNRNKVVIENNKKLE